MADFTRCLFTLPFKITTATQIKLVLADSAVGGTTITATAVAGTYYNDLDVTGASLGVNLLEHLISQLEAAEGVAGTNGSWSLEHQIGDYQGRYRLERESGSALDSVTSLEVIGGEVSMLTFGYASAAAQAPADGTEDPALWTAPNRAQGLWIIDDYPGLSAGAEERTSTTVLSATSPDGTTARDTYGDVTRKVISLLTLPAASVFKFYVNDADYASGLGAATGDVNACFDELRRLWSRLDADVYCRFYPDAATLTDFVQLQPGAQDGWLASLDAVADRVSSNPVLYNLTITAYVVE